MDKDFYFPLIESSANNNFSIQKVRASKGANAYHAKVTSVLLHLHDMEDMDVVVFADAFDTFARRSLSTFMDRFTRMGKDVIFSTEITSNHLSKNVSEWYRLRRGGKRSKEPNLYINTGLYAGRVHALRNILHAAKSHKMLFQGSKLRTDQTAIGESIVHFYNEGSDFMDYGETLFYTASNRRWSLSIASEEINRKDPIFVHMPFTQAPRVARTFRALYDSINGHRWPEANSTYCREQERMCKLDATFSSCHVGAGHRAGLNRLFC